jgi:hypothetical protein
MIRYVLKNVGEGLKAEEGDLPLEAMQKIVGGYLDVVALPNDIDMWVNDEGLLDGLPLNLCITRTHFDDQPIVGNVFFTSHDPHGQTVSLNIDQIEWLKENLTVRGLYVEEMRLIYNIKAE